MKFIYFDIGNVFMTYDKIFTGLVKDLDINLQKFDEAYEPYDIDANLGKIDIPDVWQKLCQQLNIKNGQNYDIVKSWISDYEAITPMHELVKSLTGKYPLGIISNYYRGYFEEATHQGFIPKINFSPVIISAEVGYMKPDTKIFQIAEDKCGYKGEKILFIDDKQENLDAAQKLGWQTFLFNYHNSDNSVKELQSVIKNQSVI